MLGGEGQRAQGGLNEQNTIVRQTYTFCTVVVRQISKRTHFCLKRFVFFLTSQLFWKLFFFTNAQDSCFAHTYISVHLQIMPKKQTFETPMYAKIQLMQPTYSHPTSTKHERRRPSGWRHGSQRGPPGSPPARRSSLSARLEGAPRLTPRRHSWGPHTGGEGHRG